MFIDCPSCGTSYNVADDKIRGRRVRVRCKNCGDAIVVDGRQAHEELTRQLSPDDATRQYGDESHRGLNDTTREYDSFQDEEATKVFSPSAGFPAPRAAAPALWHISSSDGAQQTLDLDAVVDSYNAGFISDDAHVWKEGMGDWVLLGDVPEIQDAIDSASRTRVVDPPAALGRAAPRAETRRSAPPPVRRSGPPPARRSAPPPSRPVPPPAAPARRAPPPAAYAPSSPLPAAAYSPPAPPPPSSSPSEYSPPSAPSSMDRHSARLSSRREGPDLFGQPGNEDELLSSQSENALQRYDQQPTGARGNSSVLFTMDAFRRSSRTGGAPPPSSRPDEIFDLDAPAASAPSLQTDNAALLTAPPVPPPRPPAPTSPAISRGPTPPAVSRGPSDTMPPAAPRPSSGSSLPLYVLLGSIGLVAILGATWFFALRQPTTSTEILPATAESATATSPEDDEASNESSENAAKDDDESEDDKAADEPDEPAREEPEPDEPGGSPAAPAAPAPRPAPAPSPTPSPKPGPSPAAKVPAAPAPAPAKGDDPKDEKAKDESADKSLLEAMTSGSGVDVPKVELEEAAEEPSEASEKPQAEAPPFNTGAAKAALSAAAANAASCKKPDGPSGSGKAQVTFSNSGQVASASIVSGPFPGTSVGSCVTKIFRGARVPAFSGASVTVAKSFKIPD